MSNLEKLFLNISVDRYNSYRSFIDGNNLKKDIIDYMPKINQFVFSIRSIISYVEDLMHFPSNDDIRHTFTGFENDQIMSYIDYFVNEKILQCHIYSHPYTIDCLYELTNSFPGGLFTFVRKVLITDKRPFEHEFFLRITHAFPFLKILIIDNGLPQNYKQYQLPNETRRNLSIIEYPCLNELSLIPSHHDYLEQFLIDTKTYLSNFIRLSVRYYDLQKITNNFTRDETRINCAKIKYIYGIDKFIVPKHFYTYFPNIEKY